MANAAAPNTQRTPGPYEVACWARHTRDLALAYSGGVVPQDPRQSQHPRGLWFDARAGDHVVDFVETLCRHHKGEWAGQPMRLESWQRDILRVAFGWKRPDGTRRFRVVYVEVPRKNGKSQLAAALGLYLLVADHEAGAEIYSSAPLALTTPIPTPRGWTTMADLRVGDVVFDETGNPADVISMSPVFRDRQCYALTFVGGDRIIADADHRWAVRSVAVGSLAGMPRAEWRPRAVRKSTVVRTTQQLYDTARTKWGACNHRVALAGPLVLPETTLPIAPYTLGVWLGDGRQNRGAVVMHPMDAEIIDYLRSDGFDVSMHGANSTDGLLHFTVLGLRALLRPLGLMERKFVPPAYLRGSIEQRRALLAGLMDTDGTCTQTGECRFTNRNRALAEAVHELAISLGFRAHLREVEVTGSPHYVVSFKSFQDNPAFRLRRKFDRQQPTRTRRISTRTILKVEPVTSMPVKCIGVRAPSSLFLAGRGMIPTHNTKKDQAKIVHDTAIAMVKRSSELQRFVRSYRNNLHCERLGSKFEPLGADSSTLDGLNPHGNIVDELHAHKDRGVWDVLDTAMGARRQPMTIAITTAGTYEPESIGWQQHTHAVQVLDGAFEDDEFFAFIACAAEGADWTAPETWATANPNIGVSAKADYLAMQCRKAQSQPSFTNTFLRLHLNQWTQQLTRWLSVEQWAACDTVLSRSQLAERHALLDASTCYGGLDLSSKLDITAALLFFPETQDLLCRFWMPEQRILTQARRDRVPYDAWVRDGWLTATPGDVIDYDYVKDEVLALSARYRVEEWAYDPWNAMQIALQLQGEGLVMVECRQGFKTLSEPSKEFEKLIVSKALRHGGHPVMRWMVSNAAVTEDAAGNIKPNKKGSSERIDGVAAAIMALSRALVQVSSTSTYETNELCILE